MLRSSPLQRLMVQDLPMLSHQKRLCYRTDEKEVYSLFRLINREVFDSKLPTPEIQVVARTRQYWGICIAADFIPNARRSNCIIRVSDKWFCKQWLITTLAHEMCHQYQWDVDSIKRMKKGLPPLMSHGPSFFVWRDKLAKHGIPLKTAHRMKRWFKHQNMFKA